MKIVIAMDSFKGSLTSLEAGEAAAKGATDALPDADLILMPLADGGEGTVASWRNTATIRNVHPNTTVAFRMNNLSGSASDLTLYAYGADGKLVKVAPELWSITDETGAAATELTDGALYELRVTVADGGDFDLSETEKEIKLSVVLGK